MSVRRYTYLVRGDSENARISPNSEEPAPHSNRESIQNRRFPRGIVTDKQIEILIEGELAGVKPMEILQNETINPQSGSSVV